jgi:hypothetical protein
MNTRNIIVVTLALASGVLMARFLPTMEKAARGEAYPERTTLTAATADNAEKPDLESRLVTALKNTWSMRVQDGKLHISENFPPGLQVEGCKMIAYGFEVYSVGAVAAEDDKVYHARLYHSGSIRLDGISGGAAKMAWDLKWLKKVLGVPEEKVQRAFVVRFWAGDRESKVRYLINEQLWDESW